jgi:hypothetical protein
VREFVGTSSGTKGVHTINDPRSWKVRTWRRHQQELYPRVANRNKEIQGTSFYHNGLINVSCGDWRMNTDLTSRETLDLFRVRTITSKPPTSSNDRIASGLSTRMQRRVSRTDEASVGVGINGSIEVDSIDCEICFEARRRSKKSCREVPQ